MVIEKKNRDGIERVREGRRGDGEDIRKQVSGEKVRIKER